MVSKFIYKFWTCSDPDKYEDGISYEDLRPAISGAKLRKHYVVKESYSLDKSEKIDIPD